jgi:transposase-like protein
MAPVKETVMDADLFNPIFTDEDKARKWLEARVWAHGRACPHCGVFNQSTLMHGKSHRPGLYQCNACHEPFTVTVGTLYERSKIPLNKWLAATHLIMASKKGMSALQIGRMLGVSKKTAWFLCHRIGPIDFLFLRDGALDSAGGAKLVAEIQINMLRRVASSMSLSPFARSNAVLIALKPANTSATVFLPPATECLRPLLKRSRLHQSADR